jgi:hypothetical protein
MDDNRWSICQLVVETGHRFSHKEIGISAQYIESISCEESPGRIQAQQTHILLVLRLKHVKTLMAFGELK